MLRSLHSTGEVQEPLINHLQIVRRIVIIAMEENNARERGSESNQEI